MELSTTFLHGHSKEPRTSSNLSILLSVQLQQDGNKPLFDHRQDLHLVVIIACRHVLKEGFTVL